MQLSLDLLRLHKVTLIQFRFMKITNYILAFSLSFFALNFSYAQFPGCPDVDAGPNQTLTCSEGCATITATPFQAGATTSYAVAPIPHQPPIAYDEPGGNPISVGTDDVWSPIIDLPFTFCFYGQSYTTCKVGSNGAIQFGPAFDAGGHPWSFTASVPSTALIPAGHVYGIYHDIDPSVFVANGGLVNWYLLGEAPCRIFVVTFYELAHFQCTQLRSTHMMVLYETTNAIDVYVEEKETCNSWNGGRAVIGIQNPDGSAGLTPPNRNTGDWTVSTPEAWRFSPSGPSIITNFEWQQGGQFLSSDYTLEVCPAQTTTYTSIATYTSCSGEIVVVEDEVTINPSPDAPTLNIAEAIIPTCGQSNGSITVDAVGGVPGYQFSIDNGVTYQASGTFSGLPSGTYNLTVLDDNGCQGGVTVPIIEPDAVQITIENQIEVSCFGESDGSIEISVSGGTAPFNFTINGVSNGTDLIFDNLIANSYTIIVTDAGGCTNQVTTTITEPELIPATINYPTSPICSYENANPEITGVLDGTFSSSPNGLTIEASGNLAGVVTGTTSTPGTYTVTYSYTNPNGCAYTTNASITIHPQPNVSAGADVLICDGDTYIFNASGGTSYIWQGGFIDGDTITPSIGAQTYTVTGTDLNGCQAVSTVTVTVSPYPVISFTPNPTEGYPTLDVAFENTSSVGSTGFVWNFGGNLVPSNAPIVNYPFSSPGIYNVTLTGNLNGCESSAEGQITVFNFDPPVVVVPNVFSPNSDNTNDSWQFVTLTNAKELNVVIVNRWGNVVFESNDVNMSWNGKMTNGADAIDGVYFYKYILLGLNEETYEGHGHITLVRK